MLVLPEQFRPVCEGSVRVLGRRRLGWAEFGDPDGLPVLWFHGTPGGRRQLPPAAPRLAAERGLRLIGMDRPGTGLSSTHQYPRLIDVVTDVDLLLDELGVDRFAVGGLSGGGPYALAVCHEMPERVVAGAVLGGLAPTRGVEQAPGLPRLLAPSERLLRHVAIPLGDLVTFAARPLRPYMSPLFDLYVSLGPSSDRAVLREADMKAVLLHDIATALEGGLRAPLCDMVVFARDWGFALADIEVPVTFWHGDADGIVPFVHGTHQAGLVPRGELRLCSGGGHFAGFSLTEDVLDTLAAAFTAQLDERP